jgi:hypothetical protein
MIDYGLLMIEEERPSVVRSPIINNRSSIINVSRFLLPLVPGMV